MFFFLLISKLSTGIITFQTITPDELPGSVLDIVDAPRWLFEKIPSALGLNEEAKKTSENEDIYF